MTPLGEAQSIASVLLLSMAITVILVIVGLFFALYWYYQRRLAAAVGDAQDVANLAAKRDLYVAEIAQAMKFKEESRDELLRLESERQLQESLRQDVTQLELAKSDAEQKAEEARREALESQHAVTALAEDRDRLTRGIAEAKRTAAAEQQRASELKQARVAAEDTLRTQTEAAERLVAEVASRQRELDELRAAAQVAQERRDRLDAEVRSLEIRQQTVEAEVARLSTELAEAQSSLTTVRAEVEPVREQIRERLRLEAEIKAMEERLGDLQEQRDELDEANAHRFSVSRYSDLFEVEPRCLADDVFPDGQARDVSEEDALERVAQHLSAQGLIFPRRVLNAFHTSLKVSSISPITVLAGISGTGKSELPIRYAEAMGMHSLAMAVQASWSSPQDLFGFYNYLEKRYKATELARALVRMDAFNFQSEDPLFATLRQSPRSDRVLLVLVDEMNLARVEYYFSEFLSRLEARRAVTTPGEARNRAPAEIDIDGAARSRGEAEGVSSGIRLWVGGNVLFAGTMNEDESTQALSDKVLDRANVLRFGKPPDRARERDDGGRSRKYAAERFLPYETWNRWIHRVPTDSRWRRDVNGWIEQLNGALEMIGRPFGWRVKEAILEYVANYPGVEGGSVYRTAMADQVEQKVLPKMRGIDLTHQRATESLNIVQSVLDELEDQPLMDAVRTCHQDATYGTLNWRGVTRT